MGFEPASTPPTDLWQLNWFSLGFLTKWYRIPSWILFLLAGQWIPASFIEYCNDHGFDSYNNILSEDISYLTTMVDKILIRKECLKFPNFFKLMSFNNDLNEK